MSHAAWVLYALWTGALLTGAAWVAAQAGMALGRPTRWTWLACALATVALPLLALAFPEAVTRPAGALGQAPMWSPVAISGVKGTQPTSGSGTILLAAWALLSAVTLVWVIISQWRLARLRRSWRRTVLAGQVVEVSRAFGPAVVGVFRPAIVVPEWVTTLAPAEVELVLRHETEHLSRHDARLLTLLVTCIVAVPWQVFLWLQLAGLRLALEVDCDRRVVSRSPRRQYAELLLSLAGRTGNAAAPVMWALPLVALKGRRSQLERRLEVLTRGRLTRGQRVGALAAIVAAIAMSGVACLTPPPAVESAAAQPTQLPGRAIGGDSMVFYWRITDVGSVRPGGRGELIPQTGLYYRTNVPDLRRAEGC